MKEPPIFLSYARIDGQKFALKLAEDLENAGINIWVDQMNIAAGKRWDVEVGNALRTADCILFIATEKSTTSTNVLDEVYYALEEHKRVIPVVAAACSMPFRLKRLNFIDFTINYETGLQHLLRALKTNGKTEEIELPTVNPQEENQNHKVIGNQDSYASRGNIEQGPPLESQDKQNTASKAKRGTLFFRTVLGFGAVVFIGLIILFITSVFSKTDKSSTPRMTGVTVFLQVEKGKQERASRQQGYVIMNVKGGERKLANINQNGEAYFQNLRVGDTVQLDVDLPQPYKSIYPDLGYVIPGDGRIYLSVGLDTATKPSIVSSITKPDVSSKVIQTTPKHSETIPKQRTRENQEDKSDYMLETKMCTATCDTKGVSGVEVSFADPKTNKKYRELSTGSDMEFIIPCYLEGTSVSVTFKATGKIETRNVKLISFEIPELFKTD